jgi:hypothetical protein
MSEPESVSRRASVWWPAVVGLEELLDAITRDYVAISRGSAVPSPKSVRRIAGTLIAVADSMEAGMPPVAGPLPNDPDLEPLTDAVRSVLSVLNPLPASDGGPVPSTEVGLTPVANRVFTRFRPADWAGKMAT